MKRFITMILFAGILAGCSAVSRLENATQAPSSGGNSGSVNATENSTVETSPGENSSSLNTTEASMPETITSEATSMPKPAVIKVRPPNIPVVSAPTPLAGWQTFTSTALGVAVDYPVGWSAAENDAGVRFTSSQGQLILLQMDQGNGSAPTTGQDCTTLINSNGQAGDLCFEAAASAYRAVFKKAADESTPEVTLSTISQEKPRIFLQMFDSFRFVP